MGPFYPPQAASMSSMTLWIDGRPGSDGRYVQPRHERGCRTCTHTPLGSGKEITHFNENHSTLELRQIRP